MRRNADAQPTSSCGCPCATLRPATPNTGWDYGGTSYLQLACSVADWSSSSSSSSRSRSRSSKHHEATASSSNTLLPHLIEASFCCVCNTSNTTQRRRERGRLSCFVTLSLFVTFVVTTQFSENGYHKGLAYAAYIFGPFWAFSCNVSWMCVLVTNVPLPQL